LIDCDVDDFACFQKNYFVSYDDVVCVYFLSFCFSLKDALSLSDASSRLSCLSAKKLSAKGNSFMLPSAKVGTETNPAMNRRTYFRVRRTDLTKDILFKEL
jgi:hypothetical protein